MIMVLKASTALAALFAASLGVNAQEAGRATGQGGSAAAQESQGAVPGGKPDQSAQTGERKGQQTAQQEQQKSGEQKAQGRSEAANKDERRSAAEKNSDKQAGQDSGKSAGQGEGRQAAADGKIGERERTVIRETIRGGDARRLSRNGVNFNIAVGTTVPRTIELAPLPPRIVEVVPAYRGYRYVVVGDSLIIVDPGTMEIVAIV